MTAVPKHPLYVSVITFSKGALLTVPRTREPYEGFYALPEGPVKKGETLESAAARLLRESSGLTATKSKLIGIHDSLERVERTRAYIISFLIMNWIGEVPLEGVRWLSDWRNEMLAFEHNAMLSEADDVLDMATKSRYLYAIK